MGWFSKKKKQPPPPPPPFTPPKPEPEARAGHFQQLFQPGERIGDAVIEVRTVAQLYVPSGRIIACDPLVPMDTQPFTTVVPVGTHPVEIAIARFPNEDERIAAARVRFSNEAPAQWLMALREGQNPATLKEDESFGYGVDAGMGCFMDAESWVIYDQRLEEDSQNPNASYYDDVIAKEVAVNYKHTRDWTDHHPRAGDPHNVVMFSSGFGDGIYSSYFGMRDGRPICLLTEFLYRNLST